MCKVCGPIVGTSNSKDCFWPLDQIENCFIQFTIENWEDCHFKFQNRSWDPKHTREIPMKIHTAPPDSVTDWPTMLSRLWAHSQYHRNARILFIYLFLLFVLNYKPHHMPCKLKCPIKNDHLPYTCFRSSSTLFHQISEPHLHTKIDISKWSKLWWSIYESRWYICFSGTVAWERDGDFVCSTRNLVQQ